MKVTELSSRYQLPVSDADLDALLEHRPSFSFTRDQSHDEIAFRYVDAAEKLLIMDSQRRSLARKILSAAETHCMLAFPSEKDFVSRAHRTTPWEGHDASAIMITGLSGTGKTQLFSQLHKVLGNQCPTISVPGFSGLRSLPSVRATFSKGVTIQQALVLYFPELAEVAGKTVTDATRKKGVAITQDCASKRAYMGFTALQIADELQFVATSANASATVSTLLLKMNALGPQMVYLCNLSLLNKLGSRPPEEVRRLLTNIHVMRPYREGSAAWNRFLDAQKALAPSLFSFDPVADQKTLHDWTFGVGGYAKLLFAAGIHMAKWSGGQLLVGMDQLRQGRSSINFHATVDSVNLLWRQQTERRVIDPNYWFKFDQTGTDIFDQSDILATVNEEQERQNIAARAQHANVAALALQSSMTQQERQAMASLSAQSDVKAAPIRKTRPRVGRITEEQLIEGIGALEEL